MKKLSVLALLSVIASPAFATDDVVPENVVESDVVEASAMPRLTDAEKLKLKQEFKDEIKAELKQEYKDKQHHDEIAFPNGVQIGAGVSLTSGLNGFVGYANKDFDSFWAKRFGVRFDFATTRPIRSTVNGAIDSLMDDGIDIGNGLTVDNGKFEAHHYAALVDFYPFGDTWLLGGWRLSGGYFMGELEMSADVAGKTDGVDGYYEFELSGNKYAYTGNTVHGTSKLDWKYRGPYLGTGFDIGLFSGFKIYVDAGVVFTNRAAQLSLDVPTDNLKQWNGASWDTVNVPELDTVIQETLSDAQSELDDYEFYPMIKMGFMYRF